MKQLIVKYKEHYSPLYNTTELHNEKEVYKVTPRDVADHVYVW